MINANLKIDIKLSLSLNTFIAYLILNANLSIILIYVFEIRK